MPFFKNVFFSNGFFRLLFFRSEFFWGVESIQKLVLFRFMKFSGRFRHSFTPFGANFGFKLFYELHFFLSKLRFFSEMAFSKIFFFFGWIFSTIFFSLRIFWGCSFEAENGPLSIYGVFRAIAALLRPVWSKLVIWMHFRCTFGQCELRKFLVYTKCYLLPKTYSFMAYGLDYARAKIHST